MGKFLNEYEELKLLGKGAFAKIYKVRHLELDYIRAIRVLNETVSDNDNDNKVYQSFLRECKTLLKLGNGGHPNIVRIYQPRKLQNHALVEMDYIDGYDLDDYLREQHGFIPIEEIMRFVKEIGSALAYCHVDCYEYQYDKGREYEYKLDSELKGQKFRIGTDPNNGKKDLITPLQRAELIREYGITHNDLHSKNIMRKRYDGSYILLDFGLAIQNGKAIKSSSRRDGAVEYRAPEKWNREGVISERSDIYSFGILLYELLAGRVPFPFQRDKYSKEEEALFKLSLDHESAIPPDIEPLRRAAFEATHPGETYEKDFPAWLEKVIMKCLAKKPEDRYANGRELFLEIEKQMLSSQTKNDELLKIKEENKTLTNRVSALESEKIEFESQMNSLARQLARTTFDAEKSIKETSNLKEEAQNLRNERDDLKSKTSILSEQVTTLSGKNEEATKLATRLQIQLGEKEEENRTLFLELENLRKKQDEVKNKSENLTKQFAVLSGEKEKATKLSNDLQSKLDEEVKRNKTILEELNKTSVAKDDLKNKNEQLAKQIKEGPKPPSSKLWKTITGIAAMIAIAAMVFAYFYKPVEKADTSHFETTISQQKTEIESLQNDKSQLQTRLNDANTEKEQLKNQAGASGAGNAAAIATKQQEIDRLTRDNNTLKSSINQKDRTISEQEKKIKSLINNM